MFRNTLAAFVGIIAVAFAYGAAAQPVGGELKATHGSWEVRCAGENNAVCAMSQVAKNEQGQPVLQMLIRKVKDLKGPDGQPVDAVIEVFAPLGVFLPAGVGFKVDGRDIGRAVYRVCDTRACIVQEPVNAEFIGQLKKGAAAQLALVGINGKANEVQVSLSGFTKAFGSL